MHAHVAGGTVPGGKTHTAPLLSGLRPSECLGRCSLAAPTPRFLEERSPRHGHEPTCKTPSVSGPVPDPGMVSRRLDPLRRAGGRRAGADAEASAGTGTAPAIRREAAEHPHRDRGRLVVR